MNFILLKVAWRNSVLYVALMMLHAKFNKARTSLKVEERLRVSLWEIFKSSIAISITLTNQNENKDHESLIKACLEDFCTFMWQLIIPCGIYEQVVE